MRDDEPWAPLSLHEARNVFATLGAPWWIAGGVALELFAGKPIRAHRDLDILILRRDQQRLRETLAGWDVCVPDGAAGLRAWREGERLESPINNAWCRRDASAPWSLEILLDDADGERWVSRRCARVSRALSSLGWFYSRGVPVLAPEIQLFYKAKDPRPQDELDAAAVFPLLNAAQRSWLDEAKALLAHAGGVPPQP
jgi:aminoglycoside-2''-adenylyltransferase